MHSIHDTSYQHVYPARAGRPLQRMSFLRGTIVHIVGGTIILLAGPIPHILVRSITHLYRHMFH